MEPQHYFNLSSIAVIDGGTRYTNRIVAAELKYINTKTIQKAKDDNDLPDSSVLMSVSYLGFMTEKQWEGN